MGGKFFDSTWRESAVKNKKFRQGGTTDPPFRKRSNRKKIKHIKLQYLQLRHPWWRDIKRGDGCWVLFPCEKLTYGFHWGWSTKYEKLRDAKNAVRVEPWFECLAWRITDKSGNLLEGGLCEPRPSSSSLPTL